MKVLWLSNVILPAAAEVLGLPPQVGGGWLTGQIEALAPCIEAGEIELCVLAPNPKLGETRRGRAGGVGYIATPGGEGRDEAAFAAVLAEEKPELVHVFGTEYPHNHRMLRLAGAERTVVSIQGLASAVALHYTDGLPARYRRRNPVKMLMKHLYAAGVIADEQRQFALRGAGEAEMLRAARHVIGRTSWDEACLWLLNPDAAYHHCAEVLRAPFYGAESWDAAACRPHSIFLSQAYYPVKGAHLVLEQLPEILRRWPDARVTIAGQKPYSLGLPGTRWLVDFFFEYQGYLKKLCRRLGVENKVEWLGPLDAEGMKAAYLAANVFLCPSAIENSPNSLAEAMALGMPVIASRVGGVDSLLRHGEEGLLYPAAESYLLPRLLAEVFASPDATARRGAAARRHALETHDREAVTRRLLDIYREVLG